MASQFTQARKTSPPLRSMHQANPMLRKKEDLFNFFGVLNFKIRRFNRNIMQRSFIAIEETARDKYFQLLLKSTALITFRDFFIAQVHDLSIEVNRRNNLKHQTMFKMSKNINGEMKMCLKVLRLFNRKAGLYKHDKFGYENKMRSGRLFLGDLSIALLKLNIRP